MHVCLILILETKSSSVNFTCCKPVALILNRPYSLWRHNRLQINVGSWCHWSCRQVSWLGKMKQSPAKQSKENKRQFTMKRYRTSNYLSLGSNIKRTGTRLDNTSKILAKCPLGVEHTRLYDIQVSLNKGGLSTVDSATIDFLLLVGIMYLLFRTLSKCMRSTRETNNEFIEQLVHLMVDQLFFKRVLIEGSSSHFPIWILSESHSHCLVQI